MSNPYAAPAADLAESMGEETYEPKLFSVNGRIGRLRYLAYGYCAMFLVMIACGILVGVLTAAKMPAVLIGAIMVLAYIPILALAFIYAKRRLNDLDSSGWWSLLLIVPLVNGLFGLYLVFAPGTAGPNSYGPRPSKNSTLVVIGGLLLPIMAVIGILAAVAIPAYHGYAMKAKAAAHQGM